MVARAEMHPLTSPSTGTPSFLGTSLVGEFESPSAILFLSSLFLQSGGMDLSRVGERLLSSVRSARSLGILPSAPSDRPEVPARAAAAAAVARALAGLPPHQRLNLPSSSEELVSIYGSRTTGQNTTDDLEEDFYEEDFDPVRLILKSMPSEGSDLTYFEEQATLRLAQLDLIAERLARHVMEHHEEMVKGMQLVRELEHDLKVANVVCMNGRRHLTSSMNEVSRDLVVHSSAKKKQVLLDMLPILAELHHALDMRMELEILVEDGNYFRAFQVFSEYLQVLDGLSGLSAIQELSQGVEDWLSKTLQKLDSLLFGVCQNFNDVNYLTAIDAYAIIGDCAGLAEKIQSFFMQEVLSETHNVLKDILQEDIGQSVLRNRFTYSDLCARIPESKFRQCLLSTLGALFKLMCSYYAIMSFEPEELDYPSSNTKVERETASERSGGCLVPRNDITSGTDRSEFANLVEGTPGRNSSVTEMNLKDVRETHTTLEKSVYEDDDHVVALQSGSSPFYQLRREATKSVSRTLERGRRNLWQLTTSRLTVLLSCSAVCSTSTHQFLRNYEDLKVFILAGEAFCGVEALDFRQRLKQVCETYVSAFHRQNIYALKMVLEKETWVKISSDATQAISLAGLVGDGAALITPVSMANLSLPHSKKNALERGEQKNGFAHWLRTENPFLARTASPRDSSVTSILPNGTSPDLSDRKTTDVLQFPNKLNGSQNSPAVRSNSNLEDENEDLLADFIDEDSQLPSRNPRTDCSPSTSHWNDEDISTQTGSSICLLRLMDKYARLMQKLELVNVEFFKGICQLFGIFFHFIYETFGQRDANLNGKVQSEYPTYRLKLALSRIAQDCDQWIKHQNIPCSPTSSSLFSASFSQIDVTPTIPVSTIFGHAPSTTFGLKERCAAAETIQLVSRMLHRSRAHIQSMLQSNAAVIEDFFEALVDSVPDLIEFIHRTTAHMLLNIGGYADRVANAKWEVKELGIEHNGYVDLLLGEFKHYKTRLVHSGIHKEVQDLLLVYGLENVADILVEGLSRVKKCTDEGRALMSLDLQVLINGLQHFVPVNVKPKLQVVETFIKAYYLPETEYVHWARCHQEYSKNQIIGLVNLVAAMKSWKRKTRLEVIERIEAGN